MKKFTTIVVILMVVAAAAAGAYYYTRKGPEPQINTAQVSRGDVIEAVGATGTLEAIRTVNVGSQVSGIVQALHADFNHMVKRGQLIAKLDPSIIETQMDQARANLVRSEAELERLKVNLEDSRTKLARTRNLFEKKLATQSELDTAVVTVKSAEVQIKSQDAAIIQSQASLKQAAVNLEHTDIYSPIDGIVINRAVDVGQTVAASMQAPTLFLIAADLSKMQVKASVDEADVGKIRPNQHVSFRVDAYPQQEFSGTVSQVRLQPVITQNVVTYVAVIDVPNADLKLKPGMTATVTVEIARRENALRVPNAALRFRPTTEIFAAFNQEVPPELQRGAGGRGGARGAAAPGGAGAVAPGSPSATAPAAASPAPPAAPAAPGAVPGTTRGAASDSAPARGAAQPGQPGRGSDRGGFGMGPGGGNQDPAERQRRFEERMASMSPEEREQFLARMKERGLDPAAGGGRGFGAGPSAGGQQPRSFGPQNPPVAASPASSTGQTIDQLFAPLQTTITPSRAWRFIDGQLKLVRVRLGITDGTFTELVSNELQPGDELVTSVDLGGPRAAGSTASPFMPGGRPGQGMPGMPGMAGGGRR